MKFTADQAFEARDDGEPIFLQRNAAAKIASDHDAALHDYELEHGAVTSQNPVDRD